MGENLMGYILKKVVLIRLIKSARIKENYHKKASNFLRMRNIINIKHIEKDKMNKKVSYKY